MKAADDDEITATYRAISSHTLLIFLTRLAAFRLATAPPSFHADDYTSYAARRARYTSTADCPILYRATIGQVRVRAASPYRRHAASAPFLKASRRCRRRAESTTGLKGFQPPQRAAD